MLKIRTQGSLDPIFIFFYILESVGDMDPESKDVEVLEETLSFFVSL